MVTNRYRLRVSYAKQGRLRYLSHLEVIGTIERCVRRAQLPFAVSEGFNVRMRLNFSKALSQGSASDCEYYDLLLTEYVPAAEALERLIAATPADLAPFSARYVAWEEPSLEAFLVRSDWKLELIPTSDQPLPTTKDLDAALSQLAQAGELSYQRGNKIKRIDLTHTLMGWELHEEASACVLTLHTRTGQGASLRLDVLVRLLFEACHSDASYILLPTRTAQYGEDSEGEMVSA